MEYLKRNLIFELLFILLIACGCGGKSKPGFDINQSFYINQGFYINEDIDFSYIKRVAVLPLDNLTNDKFAGDAVRHVVMSELLATRLVEVSCPGDAIAALESMKIKPGHALNAEQIKAVGKSLNVQAVVLGAVNKYGEVREGNISAPEVSITLMMADTGSGSIIWSITKSQGGAGFWSRHFGARSATMSETVLAVVREALKTLYNY